MTNTKIVVQLIRSRNESGFKHKISWKRIAKFKGFDSMKQRSVKKMYETVELCCLTTEKQLLRAKQKVLSISDMIYNFSLT